MNLEEAKYKFIDAWGVLGSSWGINKTMAKLHAYLLVSTKPLSSDDLMQTLNLSRGNVNMNIRSLIDWGLIYKKFVEGQRKEYFIAEKDMWVVAHRIAIARRKKEIEPVINILNNLSEYKADDTNEDEIAFHSTIIDMKEFVTKADKILGKITDSDKNWFFKKLAKLV